MYSLLSPCEHLANGGNFTFTPLLKVLGFLNRKKKKRKEKRWRVRYESWEIFPSLCLPVNSF